MKDSLYLTYGTDCSSFCGAGIFCLAHWLRQLTRNTKSDGTGLQTLLKCRNENFGVIVIQRKL